MAEGGEELQASTICCLSSALVSHFISRVCQSSTKPTQAEAGPKRFQILGHPREIATLPSQGRAPGISCPTLSSPGAVPTTTVKINKKVIFKLPRGAAVPLWVYLKSSGQLQYIITNQQERGREGGEGKEEGRWSGASWIVIP